MTHAVLATKLRPGLAAQAVLEARERWGFTISMVQSDNEPECSPLFRTTNASSRYTNQTQPATPTQRQRPHRTL